MKKVLLNILLLVTFFYNNEAMAQTPQWSNWTGFGSSCFHGFEFRVKAIGFNKYVNKYEWICEVKNNYAVKAGFDMYWTVGGEKQGIGRFDVKAGGTTYAVSYYFTSNAEVCNVSIDGIFFSGANCPADCDGRPGVANQPSCNTNASSTNNYSNTTTTNTSSGTNSLKSNTATNSYNNTSKINPTSTFTPMTTGKCHPDCQYPCVSSTTTSNINSPQQAYENPQQVYQNALNQYNETQIQNTISNIQNTPVRTFEVGKLEIKNVKRQPAGTGVDKGSVSSISGLDKIEIEFEEFSNKKENEIFDHVKPVGSTQRIIELLRSVINSKQPAKAGKMDFDLTINEKGFVVGVSLLSEPRDIELEDKVTSDIRMGDPMIFYHTPATTKNGKPVNDNISYSVTYFSVADVAREKNSKAQSEENKRKPGTIKLQNGSEYELKEDEYVIETNKVNIITRYSPTTIIARFNEFKNSIKEKFQYLKDTDLITMFQDANKSSDKTNESSGSSSSQNVEYAIINGRLCSVKRLDSKTTVYMYVD